MYWIVRWFIENVASMDNLDLTISQPCAPLCVDKKYNRPVKHLKDFIRLDVLSLGNSPCSIQVSLLDLKRLHTPVAAINSTSTSLRSILTVLRK